MPIPGMAAKDKLPALNAPFRATYRLVELFTKSRKVIRSLILSIFSSSSLSCFLVSALSTARRRRASSAPEVSDAVGAVLHGGRLSSLKSICLRWVSSRPISFSSALSGTVLPPLRAAYFSISCRVRSTSAFLSRMSCIASARTCTDCIALLETRQRRSSRKLLFITLAPVRFGPTNPHRNVCITYPTLPMSAQLLLARLQNRGLNPSLQVDFQSKVDD